MKIEAVDRFHIAMSVSKVVGLDLHLAVVLCVLQKFVARVKAPSGHLTNNCILSACISVGSR